MSTTTGHAGKSEVTMLARILGNGDGQIPREVARYILSQGFSDRDKARTHELAVRNQEDALTPAEKEELPAFAKAGTLLSILKSKARRSLGIEAQRHTPS